MELITYIQEHENWEELLTNSPFYLNISRDGEFVLFKYNQIKSDFSQAIVKECRGIILHEPTLSVACRPFDKFFNMEEVHADEIDWNTAVVSEKLDGSLIKLWMWDGELHISTNGTINAFNSQLSADLSCPYSSFGEWVGELLSKHSYKIYSGFTYLFEITGKWNKIVVPYTEDELSYLGTRNNQTGEEFFSYCGDFSNPKFYNFSNAEEVISMVKELPFNEEGYVVRDANFKRVKIKSPAYVAAHHLKNNGVITEKNILDLIITNETGEFLSYYPEYAEYVYNLQEKIVRFLDLARFAMESVGFMEFATKKDYALYVIGNVPSRLKNLMFLYYDKKVNRDNLTDWLFSQSQERILELLGE